MLDPATLAFVWLPSRYLVDGDYWKRFTLLGQSFGSVVLAWEAMDRLIPDVFIGTSSPRVCLVFESHSHPPPLTLIL